MNKFQKLVPIAVLASAACVPLTAQATNGYFSHGYGIKAKGMAGAGIAYGQDAIAAATNPANMVLVGNRVDFGLDIFRPDRSTQIEGNGGLGTVNYDPNDDSIFFIPEFGYNQMVNSTMSVGVSVFGNGGMNTSYKKPIGLFGSTNAGVNLEQLFIAPTFSMKVNPSNAFGVSLNLIYQTFEATGLQNFDNSTYSSAPGSVTDNGKDTSTGYNIRLGWTGTINPMVSWGITYQSKADMSEFDKYKGLFAEQGDFDIPETYGIGIKVSPSSKVNVAFDITKINYSGVKSINNPLLPNLSTAQLGTDNGAGFAWQDMTVYKLGVDWQVNSDLVLRAGWNHGGQPIPKSDTLFNLLAPGVVEDHLTLGGTWTLQNGSELSFFYMHAFEKTISGDNSIPAGFGGGEANLTMSQDSIGVAYGWSF
jgi:long-chain fatty acid transport protein